MKTKYNISTMKTQWITAILLLLAITGMAQQEPQNTLYMFNPLAYNPAYAGSHDAFSAVGIYRAQWLNVKGAPVTMDLAMNAPLKARNIGLGFSVTNDEIGATKNTGVYGDFVYRIRLNRKRDWLAFGVRGGVDFYRADFSDERVIDNNDPVYLNAIRNNMFNVGAGIYYYGQRHYIGISVPKVLANNIGISDLSKQVQQFYFVAGVVVPLGPAVDFKPSVNLRLTPNAPVAGDINASFLFYQRLWLGVMYRLTETAGANIAFNITREFRIGYAYDYNFSKLSRFSNGSHEIMLSFDLIQRNRGAVSPRYF
jgi:type IX secretion system PorP/SprF family membrane protein